MARKPRNIPVPPYPYPYPNVIRAIRPDPNPNIICAIPPNPARVPGPAPCRPLLSFALVCLSLPLVDVQSNATKIGTAITKLVWFVVNTVCRAVARRSFWCGASFCRDQLWRVLCVFWTAVLLPKGKMIGFNLYEISVSHGAKYEDSFLGYSVM
jgi:hypothetical protein